VEYWFLIKPIPTVEITPMPPIFETANASPEREIPIPIPSCMIGTGIRKSPMLKDFNMNYLTLIAISPLSPCLISKSTSCPG